MTSLPPNNTFTLAWLCSTPKELFAAREMFYSSYGKHPLTRDPSDSNIYELGRIGRNNVVMVQLPSTSICEAIYQAEHQRDLHPAEQDDRWAAATLGCGIALKALKRSFPSLGLAVMVTVGAGVRDPATDGVEIMRGDVIVGMPDRRFWGLAMVDFEEHDSTSTTTTASASATTNASTATETEVEMDTDTDTSSSLHLQLSFPPNLNAQTYPRHLVIAAHALRADRGLGRQSRIPFFLERMFEWYPDKRAQYVYPGIIEDKEDEGEEDEEVEEDEEDEDEDEEEDTQSQTSRESNSLVHHGTIAILQHSIANDTAHPTLKLMLKNGLKEHGIKGTLDTATDVRTPEVSDRAAAAAVANEFLPTLVICGVCDLVYIDPDADARADSPGRWEAYAAAMAAAYAKELLETLAPLPVKRGCPNSQEGLYRSWWGGGYFV
ncbi:hypothetical protein BDW74DRAFT_182449 [Aspergillus multicolor]|uniref:uncharacterized protein n=1 Tax=Aspergillus multicolor TaxID=41759 RepID=UPI003CCD0313